MQNATNCHGFMPIWVKNVLCLDISIYAATHHQELNILDIGGQINMKAIKTADGIVFKIFY